MSFVMDSAKPGTFDGFFYLRIRIFSKCEWRLFLRRMVLAVSGHP